MKILVITNLYPNSIEKNRGIFNKRQFDEISRSCSIKIIAPVAWTDKVSHYKKYKKSVPYKETTDGIDIYHPTYYFTPRILRCFYGISFLVSIYITARRILKEFNPDMVFGTWVYPDGFASTLFGKLNRLPVFLKVHGSDIHSIKGFFRKKMTVYALKNADMVFSVDDDLASKIIDMGINSEKVFRVYNGVDENLFYPMDRNKIRDELNIPGNTTILLFVGNLVHIKGPDLLLEAFYYLQSKHDNIRLYFIGKGNLEKELRESSKSMGISDKIFFLNEIVHSSINKWMNAADLLIVPSRNEGVPNVILEAMSCGIPVAGSRIGGIPEIVTENKTGLLFESLDVHGMVTIIERALNIRWDRKIILDIAKKFSWAGNAEAIVNKLKK